MGRERGGSRPRPKAAVQAHLTANEAIRALHDLLDDDALTRRNLQQLMEMSRRARRVWQERYE